jgi:hypothetical protein
MALKLRIVFIFLKDCKNKMKKRRRKRVKERGGRNHL